MSRTVIDVHLGGQGGSFQIWLSEPAHAPGATTVHPFPYAITDPAPKAFHGGHVRLNEIGEYIVGCLSAHPAVKERLDGLLNAGRDARESVFVRLPPEAESLPWEALFANGSFLALDRRWPIARMSLQARAESRTRNFQPPLKILAVLAADGEQATGEWSGLLASLERAKFPVSVKALVAEDPLHQQIAATDSPRVSTDVDYVPPTLDEFTQVIETFRPNILHFFCHGRFVGGKSYLEIGTRLSHRQEAEGKPRSPLFVESSNLPTSTLGDVLWLATLNCCKTAATPGDGGSLVFSLVSAGVPVVAGMREPVSVPDANAFSRGFYRALVELLAPARKPGKSTPIDWASALYEPRMALCDAHRGTQPAPVAAQTNREWILPVLYVNGGEFTLVGRRKARTGGRVSRGLKHVTQPRAAPSLTASERASMETELHLLSELADREFGLPADKLEALRRGIAEVEAGLYGGSAG